MGIETQEIMFLRETDARVFRHPGLDIDAAGLGAAAGSARKLGQELERPLAGAKIRKPEAHIREHHADQRDMREVKPFGDHLRSDQNIDLPRPELIQNHFMGIFFAGRVSVHPRDPCLREKTRPFAFDLLGAESRKAQERRFAGGTRVRNFFLIITVMAKQKSLLLVVRKRDLAHLALLDFVARGTADRSGESPAVEEEHGAFPVFQVRLDLARERA